MNEAESYKEWLQLAESLDRLKGLDRWRSQDFSPLLDVRGLRKFIRDMENMVKKGHIFDLMFRVRGGLSREQYGTMNKSLYNVASGGTKKIVEHYHNTISTALEYICDTEDVDIPDEAKLAFFNEARHAYGRTGLALSGGAFLGYYQAGVMKALFRQGLLPRVMSGASAGSLLVALLGTKNDEELDAMLAQTKTGDGAGYKTNFFKHNSVVKHPVGHSIQQVIPILDIKHLQETCIGNCGRYTFQEAFDHSGRIINITVSPQNSYDPPRLLNYLTSPHVCVWSAACASCAIPGMYDAAELWCKEPSGEYCPEQPRQKVGYTDGSIEADLPMQQLAELFNVNHFIVSQVNPHSAFFGTLSLRGSGGNFNEKNLLLRGLIGYTHFLKEQVKCWIKNVGIYQTLTQSYEGRENDITIMPWANHISVFQAWCTIIRNPVDEEYNNIVRAAERVTWANMSRIKAQCKVEMTLDRSVQKIRRRIAEKCHDSMFEERDGDSDGSQPDMNGPDLDRVPSFYTARSIVNMGGLSVSDPRPRTPDVSSQNGDVGIDYDEYYEEDGDGNGTCGRTGSPSLRNNSGITKSTNMASFYYSKSGKNNSTSPSPTKGSPTPPVHKRVSR
eukprot:GSChrysophyteH2.ASY1.ANO1.71.1 assembled CDS